MTSIKPNFFVIGAMKCATSSLHEQLAFQDGICMSSVKEPNFFSDDASFKQGSDWYSSIFDVEPHDTLIGESSTHYTKLPTHPKTIERMKDHIEGHQDLKFVYVMRHPVDRLVSHFRQEIRLEQIPSDISIDEAAMSFERFTAYGKYAMQLESYFEHFKRSSILPVFFERLANNPQPELERICDFLGYTGTPQWKEELKPRNSSNEMMSESKLRDTIVEAPVLKTIRQNYVPQSLRDRIKQFWIEDEKPEMTAATHEYLQTVFDPDLRQLSEALAIDPLTCENYKSSVLADSSQIKSVKF